MLFQPEEVYRMDGGSREPSKTEGTNHPNGVTTYFYLPEFNAKRQYFAYLFWCEKGYNKILQQSSQKPSERKRER